MKKKLFRNIALVTAVAALTLAIMLVTNYFASRSVTPLGAEVSETLKSLNDAGADSPELRAQIRELDLLARRAYFVRESQLKTGVWLLVGMLAVLVLSLRGYYAGAMDIPEKELDEADEWLAKAGTRRYLLGGVAALAVAGLVFAGLSMRHYRSGAKAAPQEELLAENAADAPPAEEDVPVIELETTPAEDQPAAVPETPAEETAPADSVEIPKTTHNAFRGNNGSGSTAARGVPTRWNLSSGSNIAWRASIPRPGFGSPVVSGRNVFLSGADDAARELYCYDLFTGELRWRLAASGIAGSPATMPRVNADTGLAASSVATNGEKVCAIFATGDIICADADGHQLWARNIGVPDNHYGYASSLLIFGNFVFVQYDNDSDGKILALSITSGRTAWEKSRSEIATWSSPVIAWVDRKAQLVVMGNPHLSAYNPNNGELLWQVDAFSGEVGASPCASNGIIYGASEYAKLVAVDGKDGTLLWESSDYLPEVSSPTATRDYVYVATSYGVVACYSAASGELLAESDLGTQLYSSPMLVEGRIWIFDTEGTLHIFRNDGKLTKSGSVQTGEPTFATPAFTDGRAIVRTTSSLYCVANPA